ncbi:MAG: zinc-dependent peptidase [Cyclobacteriaceae bacterium]|nr:zinc-dependent peptidase [Cyclobacteriaceae bacterium]
MEAGTLLFVSLIVLASFLTYRYRGYMWPAPLTREEEGILEKYFSFYQHLPPVSKGIFKKRVARFIWEKKFVPRNLSAVSNEMKVCISASAVQLTFGLPGIYLRHFRYILVYPDSYYSQITRKYHKGEVNPRNQAIVISWRAYVEGYAIENGLNLGLHEMAHALHLENTIRNEEFDFLPQDQLAQWDSYAQAEMEKIQTGAQTFFRPYGAVDTFEFFAVAVENFFERPAEFKAYHAGMYQAMCGILNQNPLLLM